MSLERFNQIKSILGKPSFEENGVAIYQMDCFEAMKKIPDELIDLTITSPPYNIGKEYEELAELSSYIDWCEQWIAEIYRITVPTGTFWLNVGYLEVEEKGLAVPIPYLLWNKTPFYFLQEVVWNYAAGVACKKRFSPRNEKLLWYVKNSQSYTFNLDAVRDPNVKYPNQKKNGKLKCNPLGKNPSDVWQITKVTSGRNRSSVERTPHPAQFPLALVERMLKSSSNEGDIILDPFMGSGSTAECALRNGRYVVGFELKGEYIEYAQQRIETYLEEQALSSRQVSLLD
ncbi:site-specific DNA-methyltransferase [Vibrio cholerae]|uniref:DNA-methyltransferase n=1 Tax=Vibrio cholerae TaxID=666 RepID=UPI0006158A98|nr:site-specific DNA-methyltransferase [Vibrio cholerae]AKB03540.1 DNA methylase family protein [Vibrio cholerae]EGQ7645072.1 site-specific DNA-methyltransferase [Vibrio cholerae]EGR2420265.1 site-specific DNA-methyltransferase [Vibrio cholerae]EGR2569666.1 site-specific DNA-methyltransferase [Vibrio cholerae]EJL6274775.1 site-specific DNA-methyltransferase [Vibrio cholerae]